MWAFKLALQGVVNVKACVILGIWCVQGFLSVEWVAMLLVSDVCEVFLLCVVDLNLYIVLICGVCLLLWVFLHRRKVDWTSLVKPIDVCGYDVAVVLGRPH